MGRPSTYTPEISEQFCSRFAAGEEPADICRADDFPNIWSITRWRRKHPEFAGLYADAQTSYEKLTFAEMKQIVDDRSKDFIDRKTGQHVSVDYEAVGRSKLRYEERRNRLAKLNPKKFGDLSRSEVSGPNGSPIEVKTASEPASDLDRAKALCFLNNVGGAEIVPAHAFVFVPLEGSQSPDREKLTGFAQLMGLSLVDPDEAWRRLRQHARIESPVREPVALPPANTQFIEAKPTPTGFMNGAIK